MVSFHRRYPMIFPTNWEISGVKPPQMPTGRYRKWLNITYIPNEFLAYFPTKTTKKGNEKSSSPTYGSPDLTKSTQTTKIPDPVSRQIKNLPPFQKRVKRTGLRPKALRRLSSRSSLTPPNSRRASVWLFPYEQRGGGIKVGVGAMFVFWMVVMVGGFTKP